MSTLTGMLSQIKREHPDSEGARQQLCHSKLADSCHRISTYCCGLQLWLRTAFFPISMGYIYFFLPYFLESEHFSSRCIHKLPLFHTIFVGFAFTSYEGKVILLDMTTSCGSGVYLLLCRFFAESHSVITKSSRFVSDYLEQCEWRRGPRGFRGLCGRIVLVEDLT